MPNIEITLPAGIGEEVSVAGQDVLLTGWRLTRPQFLLGGALDRAPQLTLQVITEQGVEFWLAEGEVTGLADPVVVRVFLPLAGGDAVLVQPSGARGEVVGQQAGWDLLERLHEGVSTTGIPVVVVSTSSRLLEEAQEQAARFGTHHYLVKPFNIDDLLDAIEDMIGTA